jgi:serine/threonine protein phosphatase PrpC
MKFSVYNQASIDHPERCEDAVLTFPGNGKAPIFAVIDGMGGHQHQNEDGTTVTGREAAQMVRDTLIEDLEHFPTDVDGSPEGEAEKRVIAALNRAHKRVYNELNDAEERPPINRVGAVATVVVICENGARVLAIQVGDTRGYLFSEGELIQLCQDEDNIEFLVRQNILSAEDGARLADIIDAYDGVNEPKVTGSIRIAGQPYELYLAWRWFLVGNSALNIPGANVVINAIGIYPEDPLTQVSRIEISEGDRLFLCSDGIYKNLTESEMENGLSQVSEDTALKLGEAALARSKDENNRRRTPDDISAIVVDFN